MLSQRSRTGEADRLVRSKLRIDDPRNRDAVGKSEDEAIEFALVFAFTVESAALLFAGVVAAVLVDHDIGIQVARLETQSFVVSYTIAVPHSLKG